MAVVIGVPKLKSLRDELTLLRAQLQRNRSRWIDVPYAASNFSYVLVTGRWNVTAQNQLLYRYRIVDGNTMDVHWIISDGAVTGADNALLIRIPGGYKPTTKMSGQHTFRTDTGAGSPAKTGLALTDPGYRDGKWIQLYRTNETTNFPNWTSGANVLTRGSILFEIEKVVG